MNHVDGPQIPGEALAGGRGGDDGGAAGLLDAEQAEQAARDAQHGGAVRQPAEHVGVAGGDGPGPPFLMTPRKYPPPK